MTLTNSLDESGGSSTSASSLESGRGAIEEALRCLGRITDCISVAIVEQHWLPRMTVGVGQSLGQVGVRIAAGVALQGEEATWIADTSVPYAGQIYSSERRLSMAMLPLSPNDQGVARRLLLVREKPGRWKPTEQLAAASFIPLIETLSRVREERPADSGQAIVDSITDLAWIKDGQSRFIAVNQPLAKLLGHTPEQMMGTTDYDYFRKEIADEYVRGDLQVLVQGSAYSSVDTIRDADGGTRWIETIKTPVRDEAGTVIGTAGVARDITVRHESEAERRRLSEELALERDRMNDMISNVPGVVWEEMFDGSHRFVSDQVESLLGYTVAEYLEAFPSFLDVLHEDDRTWVEQSNGEMIASRTGGSQSFRMIRKDGSSVWCESHCRVIADAAGHPIGLRGVSIDVSARKSAEDRLRASEEHFRNLADATPVMIWTTNAAGEAEFQNRRLLDFTGATESEARGHGWQAWIHPDDCERVRRMFEEAKARQNWISFEMRYLRHDGVYRELFVEAAPRDAGDGRFGGFAGSCLDLTDRRHLERRLEQERQLGSLGRLAATIAHEINNVLMAIQPFADVIRKGPSQEVLTRAADHITTSIHRGGRITHQILRFAKPSEPVREPVEVGAWLTSISGELKALMGPRIELRVDLDPSLCMLADRNQMMQVFTNIAMNTRDAISGAGTLTVRGGMEQSWPGLPPETGPFVHLVVSDDGPGIAPAALDRLFEPLFTTRTGGTGLGLAIVHDIVRRHGGDIYAESTSAEGATFHLILAAAESNPVEVQGEESSLPPAVRRILLVEDDEMVSTGVAALLELEGAEVFVVALGAEALDAVTRFKPDLVVLDIGLPDIPGTVVFEQIRGTSPNLPVLFSTGHAGEIESESGGMNGPTAHLLKPYDVATLIATIRKLVK